MARRIFVGDLRAQAVALFARNKQQADVDLFVAQALGGGDLGGDDALGVARSAAINSRGVFGRRNEWRNRIQMRGENDVWNAGLCLPASSFRPFRRHGIDVEAIAFHRHFLRLISQPRQFPPKIVSDRGFVAGDRFDVDQLTRERDGVHGGENSRGERGARRKAGVRGQGSECRSLRILTSDFPTPACNLTW